MSAVVYRLIGPCESLLYIGRSEDFPARLRQHRRRFRVLLVRYELEPHATLAAASLAEREAIEREEPLFNVALNLIPRRTGAEDAFGARLWDALEEHGLTLPDLSQATGIPLVTLHRRLSTSETWTLGELTRIAALLNTTAGQLVTEFEEKAA